MRKAPVLFILGCLLCWSPWLYSQEMHEYDLTGATFALSGFDYFSTGIGYNWGSLRVWGPHYSASVMGLLLEYKTLDEIHLRTYGRLYGGSGGMLLGVSGLLASDFSKASLGISPEVGFGFGPMNVLYRYNFYLDSTFNCHEIALSMYPYPSEE